MTRPPIVEYRLLVARLTRSREQLARLERRVAGLELLLAQAVRELAPPEPAERA